MIDIICSDIEKAVSAGAYISAISLALTLPDWCGKAEYPSESTTSRYKKWYRGYIGEYESFEGNQSSFLSADVVYSLRNHLLHQGAFTYDNKDVHQEQNKVDKFILYFNVDEFEGCKSVRELNGKNGEVLRRSFAVNALNLIMKLKRCASAYYHENKEKFDFLNLEIHDRWEV